MDFLNLYWSSCCRKMMMIFTSWHVLWSSKWWTKCLAWYIRKNQLHSNSSRSLRSSTDSSGSRSGHRGSSYINSHHKTLVFSRGSITEDWTQDSVAEQSNYYKWFINACSKFVIRLIIILDYSVCLCHHHQDHVLGDLMGYIRLTYDLLLMASWYVLYRRSTYSL